jgi:ABC-type Mn2+/Zn2+ transport system permease subunit
MDESFVLSLITGIFIGGAAGYLGSLMIGKRMALVGDALGHIALPGIGLAFLLGFNVSFGAFVFLLLGIFLVWFLETKTSLHLEALVGVIFVVSLAVGFLIVPNEELVHSLIGDISHISFSSFLAAISFSTISVLVLYRIYPRMILANISRDLAISEKIDVKRDNFIYLLMIALVVALGIRVTGSLLVGALLIIPAASARNLSASLKEYIILSSFLGAVATLLGIVFYRILHFPAGPLIILISALLFVFSLVFKK